MCPIAMETLALSFKCRGARLESSPSVPTLALPGGSFEQMAQAVLAQLEKANERQDRMMHMFMQDSYGPSLKRARSGELDDLFVHRPSQRTLSIENGSVDSALASPPSPRLAEPKPAADDSETPEPKHTPDEDSSAHKANDNAAALLDLLDERGATKKLQANIKKAKASWAGEGGEQQVARVEVANPPGAKGESGHGAAEEPTLPGGEGRGRGGRGGRGGKGGRGGRSAPEGRGKGRGRGAPQPKAAAEQPGDDPPAEAKMAEAAVKQKIATFSVERSRKQVMVRVGPKGDHKCYGYKYGDGRTYSDEVAAVRAAQAWIDAGCPDRSPA